MDLKQTFAGLPWWVTWVAIPLLVVLVFGGIITSVLSFVIGIVFKLLILAVLVAGLIYLVRKATSSSSRGDW